MLGQQSNIESLHINGIQTEMSVAIELLGEALSENTKIKILKMSENKMRATSYIKFW